MKKNRIESILERLVICEPTTLPTGCWIWPGRLSDGYGLVSYQGKHACRVHRVIYEHFCGPIPEGLQCDHLCRNRACANFEHIEPVTHRENVLRGTSFVAVHARKTHCIHGHPLTPDNTYACKAGKSGRWRVCKTCFLESGKRSDQKKRALKAATATPAPPRTHCIHGHLLSEDNFCSYRNGSACLKCTLAQGRERTRRYRERKREQARREHQEHP